jgi:hypothetical protein
VPKRPRGECDHRTLTSVGTAFLGIWKHWFSTRPFSFVQFSLEQQRAIEIARSPCQFTSYAIIQAMSVLGGESPEVLEFANRVQNICVPELRSHPSDDPATFGKLSMFSRQSPLVTVLNPTQYDGEFPIEDWKCGAGSWESASSVEVSADFASRVPAGVSLPAWFRTTSVTDLFRDYLARGDFKSAWLTINSGTWESHARCLAFQSLAIAAGDPMLFQRLEAWATFEGCCDGGL